MRRRIPAKKIRSAPAHRCPPQEVTSRQHTSPTAAARRAGPPPLGARRTPDPKSIGPAWLVGGRLRVKIWIDLGNFRRSVGKLSARVAPDMVLAPREEAWGPAARRVVTYVAADSSPIPQGPPAGPKAKKCACGLGRTLRSAKKCACARAVLTS